MNILRTAQLNRSFRVGGTGIDVLKGINLEIERGTFNILMGPSGSGKTTLLNILGALDKPNTGKVYIDGEVITGMSESKRDSLRRGQLGFVFNSVALVSKLSAFENIDFALAIS
mgnify:CR=1 FL=1